MIFRRVFYSTYYLFLKKIDNIHNLIYKIKHDLSIRDKAVERILSGLFEE